MKAKKTVLVEAAEKLVEICRENSLEETSISVVVKVLTPEEAIGSPGRRDFPILVGRERVIEADFRGFKAHAYTDSPCEFTGKLGEILKMPLEKNAQRALLISAMNAVLSSLYLVKNPIHCKDDDPESCSSEICSVLKAKLKSQGALGLIGMNPAILDGLRTNFKPENVRVSDLDPSNIGKVKYGCTVWDGKTMNERLVSESDIVLLTGTTLVNGTFDRIFDVIQSQKKEYYIYGVTCAGVCELMGLDRICPRARENSRQ